jgi:hypothetical protein
MGKRGNDGGATTTSGFSAVGSELGGAPDLQQQQ